jgi:hypothetical protein
MRPIMCQIKLEGICKSLDFVILLADRRISAGKRAGILHFSAVTVYRSVDRPTPGESHTPYGPEPNHPHPQRRTNIPFSAR